MRDYRDFLGELKPDCYRQVKKEAARIAAAIFQDDMPDVVKAYEANRYLAEHIRYDCLWYDQGHLGVDKIPAVDRTLEGALLNRVAVCAGIAKAYAYLLSFAGIPCWYMRGEAEGGGSHAWNVLQLDGEMYQVDVTWNLREGGPDWCDHYFLLSDEEMRRTRSWKLEDYPACPPGRYANKRYRRVVEEYHRRCGAERRAAV